MSNNMTYESMNKAGDVQEIRSLEEYDGGKAKQRSSILWLVAKANNNKVPDDLKEPYYRDHEDQDQLKPVIIHALASAECYCLALGNIYADPNYHRLNHWGVIQALARKGVYVAEPSDVALTETVLIQTSPIRMSAHMAVIEAIMALYIKETVTTEKIVQAIKRFSSFSASNELPVDTEEALVLWINKACVKMKHRIEEEMNANDPEIQKSGYYMDYSPPAIPILRDLSDLSDGCCLATLISFYCSSALKWQDICYNTPMSMPDSLYNLQIVQKFCRDHMPFNPCFLSLEDLVYQHSSVRQNILAFLSDLFFLFEIKPARCVQLHSPKDSDGHLESQNGRAFPPVVSAAGSKRMFQQSSVGSIPDLRSNAYSSMPDINRISPKSGVSPQSVKEPMFPRRQLVTQPETRTLERQKRYSFHEASRGSYSHAGANNKTPSPIETNSSGSIRRTHSLLDINRTTPDQATVDSRIKTRESAKSANGESRNERLANEVESESDRYYVHHSRGFPTPASSKVPDRTSNVAFDELDENYSKSSTKYEDERLLPAQLKPAKEKNNSDTKTEERGEFDRRRVSQSPAAQGREQPQTRPKVDGSPRRYSSEEGKENRLRVMGESTHVLHSVDNVPKHSTKNTFSQVRVGESFSYPDKYSLEAAKAAGIPIIQDENYVPYEGFHDNRELEEQLANQNFSKTTLYVPGGDSNKTQYIIISTGDKSKDECDEKLITLETKEPINTTSFAQLSKLRDTQKGGINIVYMQHDRDHNFDGSRHPLKSSFLQKKSSAEKKTTTFATLPNQTTWQQQQGATSVHQSPSVDSGHETPSDGSTDPPLATQVHNVRLKLEEKRRRIEVEKRKMEVVLNRARQKVGKAAFLQAVSKGGKGSGRNTPDSGASGDLGSPTTGINLEDSISSGQEKSYTMEEIADNLNMVQNKWLESQISVDTLSASDSNRPSPDVDGLTYEEYTRSLERMNTNLTDLQSDIQRLSQQQQQIQQFVHNGLAAPRADQQQSYYVEGTTRQQWGPPQQQQQMMTHEQMMMANQQQQWGGTVVSVRPDVHISSGPPMMQHPQQQQQQQQQQRMGGATPYYLDQQNYMVQNQSRDGGGFSLQPTMAAQNGPSHHQEQYTSYGRYNVPQYGGGYQHQHQHQQQQQQQVSDVYAHYTSPQPAPAPFRLHVEGPRSVTMSSPQQQQQTHISQAQMVYQKPVMTSTQKSPAQRPISIHTSMPSKAPVQAPPESYMEPQTVHFIESEGRGGGNDYDAADTGEMRRSLNSLESLSGTSTYRVRDSVSPNRPALGRTFRVPKMKAPPSPTNDTRSDDELSASPPTAGARCSAGSDKGFFVAFDDEDQPRRAKPPLRMKKGLRGVGGRDDESFGQSAEAEGDSVLVSGNNSRASSLDRSGSASKEASPKPQRNQGGTENVIKVRIKQDSGEPSVSVVQMPVVDVPAIGFVIGEKEGQTDNTDEDEMVRKRERILMNALRRKEEQETKRARQEMEGAHRREQERMRQEMIERKREDERARRQAILDQYKQRKALEEQEPMQNDVVKTSTLPKSRPKHPKQRPKSLHESAMSGLETRSSNLNLASSGSRGSQQNLSSQSSDTSPYRGYSEADVVGIGRSTPPRRAPSPGQYVYRNPLSPSSGSPGLPPGLVGRRGGPISDTASDTCSTTSSMLEYTGPKLFKQPTAKSNRGIIINAINSVLAGAVNQETKKRALEEIAQSDSKHFLILFRDSGCQFRALYSYFPEREDVFKLFGTGPKQVTEHMIDRFYKYNSGGKSFMEIQTKHLTVTIDAFTIHNTLWQGKKGTLPRKELY